MSQINFVMIFLFLSSYNNFIYCQLSDVRLLNHLDYMLDAVHETVKVMEERGWSTFTVPDTNQSINETVFDWDITGTVSYTDGFLVKVQHLDIVQNTVQQVWNRTALGLVDVQARFRMHNVAIGFNVLAKISDEMHQYTAMYVHPLVTFDFSIVKDFNDDSLSINVNGAIPNSNNLVQYLPLDYLADVLTTLYDKTITVSGVTAWGSEILTPIVTDIVTNKVAFPTVCYNCPV